MSEGIDKDILNDKRADGFFADEYVWDTIADHMDSIWDELTQEQRDSLREDKCKPCKGQGRGGHKGCEWICPDCNGTGKYID